MILRCIIKGSRGHCYKGNKPAVHSEHIGARCQSKVYKKKSAAEAERQNIYSFHIAAVRKSIAAKRHGGQAGSIFTPGLASAVCRFTPWALYCPSVKLFTARRDSGKKRSAFRRSCEINTANGG